MLGLREVQPLRRLALCRPTQLSHMLLDPHLNSHDELAVRSYERRLRVLLLDANAVSASLIRLTLHDGGARESH
jgi:hypothetical protein